MRTILTTCPSRLKIVVLGTAAGPAAAVRKAVESGARRRCDDRRDDAWNPAGTGGDGMRISEEGRKTPPAPRVYASGVLAVSTGTPSFVPRTISLRVSACSRRSASSTTLECVRMAQERSGSPSASKTERTQ